MTIINYFIIRFAFFVLKEQVLQNLQTSVDFPLPNSHSSKHTNIHTYSMLVYRWIHTYTHTQMLSADSEVLTITWQLPNLPCLSGNVYCLYSNIMFLHFIFILLISFLSTEDRFWNWWHQPFKNKSKVLTLCEPIYH